MTPKQRNHLRIAAISGRADEQFQRDTVAVLVSYIERMVGAGDVSEKHETRLRELTNTTCAVFGMPSIAERDAVFEANLAILREVL
ncbi:hypothetical protein [Tardiphaga sp.]|jgi:hypothetical protein|uniref:hypothetical protein n=1 Tax=Tardiphaga sp. TaxID=1926292 RepID=UPI0037DA6AE9